MVLFYLCATVLLINHVPETKAFDTKYDEATDYANYFDDPNKLLKMIDGDGGNSTGNMTLPQPIMVRLREGEKPGDKVIINVYKIDPKILIPLTQVARASLKLQSEIMERIAKKQNQTRDPSKFQYFRTNNEMYGPQQEADGVNRIIQYFRTENEMYRKASGEPTTVQYFKSRDEMYHPYGDKDMKPAPYFKSKDELYGRNRKWVKIPDLEYFKNMTDLYMGAGKAKEERRTTPYFRSWDELYIGRKVNKSEPKPMPRMQGPEPPFGDLKNIFKHTNKPYVIIIDAFDLNPETLHSMKRKEEIMKDIQFEVVSILNGTKNYTAELFFNFTDGLPIQLSNLPIPGMPGSFNPMGPGGYMDPRGRMGPGGPMGPGDPKIPGDHMRYASPMEPGGPPESMEFASPEHPIEHDKPVVDIIEPEYEGDGPATIRIQIPVGSDEEAGGDVMIHDFKQTLPNNTVIYNDTEILTLYPRAVPNTTPS